MWNEIQIETFFVLIMQPHYRNQRLRSKFHKHDLIALQYAFLLKKKTSDKI